MRRIYDVAVSDGRTIGEDGRCKEPVGNTVDLEAATWTNTIGASELTDSLVRSRFRSKRKGFLLRSDLGNSDTTLGTL